MFQPGLEISKENMLAVALSWEKPVLQLISFYTYISIFLYILYIFIYIFFYSKCVRQYNGEKKLVFFTFEMNYVTAPLGGNAPSEGSHVNRLDAVVVGVSVSYLGPKHMHRLARYPLEKAKTIIKKMYQASCSNSTGR